MAPSLPVEAAEFFDAEVRNACAATLASPITDATWSLLTMPLSFVGMGLTSAVATRHGAHYASWAAS